ncbi:radical SAM protein [Thermogladius sp. 4427co]|uniref:radical SAM protein n=1 Tax=Thermogladius sp. 4427co TaxID=3450718 RepID=UPI003F793814
MGRCRYCGRTAVTVSDTIGACVDCIRSNREALARVLEVHSKIRGELGKPTVELEEGVKCVICGRGCHLGPTPGYCGIRYSLGGVVRSPIGPDEILGFYYYDPHPTNCVAVEVCPAAKGIGYPRYALKTDGEKGYYNIAVFVGACNLNCLYCQNWEHHLITVRKKPVLRVSDLVDSVNHKTTCVCFFGGDPSVFSTTLIQAARKMVERAKELGLKVFRVCWETNGLWNPMLLDKAVELSLETGGIVKIDFKAWSPEVYSALTGIRPELVELIRENIRRVAKRFNERKDPPLLVISTLLVPGYIDEYEIDNMTRFIADLNNEIPYVFLGFHPDFRLTDLPTTSWHHALKAVEIARRNGLKRVFVENTFLLGYDYRL